MILFKAAYQAVLSISKAHWKAHFWTDLQSTVILKQLACILKDFSFGCPQMKPILRHSRHALHESQLTISSAMRKSTPHFHPYYSNRYSE
jgi:hypothetical protein